METSLETFIFRESSAGFLGGILKTFSKVDDV